MNRVEAPTTQKPAPAVPNGHVNVSEAPHAPLPQAPFEQQLPPEKRSLARKIFDGLRHGVKNWAKNLDPRGKSIEWKLGVGVGVVESLGFMALPIPAVKGYVKAGINFALAQGVYFAARKIQSKEERRVEQEFKGDKARLQEEKQKLLEKHGKAQARMRNFFLGVSAGATYISATNLGIEAAKSVAAHMGHTVEISALSAKIPAAEAAGYHDTPAHSLTDSNAHTAADASKSLTSTNIDASSSDVYHDVMQQAPPPPIQETQFVPDATVTAPYQETIAIGGGHGSIHETQFITDPSVTTPSQELVTPGDHGSTVETQFIVDPTVTSPVQETINPAPSTPTGPAVPSAPPGGVAHAPVIEGLGGVYSSKAAEEAATKFQEAIAAEVGKQMPQINTMTDEILRSYNVDPNAVPPELYNQIHAAIQHEVEKRATDTFVSFAGGHGQDLSSTHWSAINPQSHMTNFNTMIVHSRSIVTGDTRYDHADIIKTVYNKTLLPRLIHADNTLSQLVASLPKDIQAPMTGNQAVQYLTEALQHAQKSTGVTYPQAENIIGHLAANYEHVKNAFDPTLARVHLHPGLYALTIEELESELEKAKYDDTVLLMLSQRLKVLLQGLLSTWSTNREPMIDLSPEGVKKALELLRKAKQLA